MANDTKKILVTIDQDHYTDVYFYVVKDNDDAVEVMRKGMDGYDVTFEDDEKGNRRISLDCMGYEGGLEKRYTVNGQTFSIPNDHRYVLIHHHAYDGVDFDVAGTADDIGCAIILKENAIKKYLEEHVVTTEFDYSGQTCFDNGNEWNIFTLFDVETEREVA